MCDSRPAHDPGADSRGEQICKTLLATEDMLVEWMGLPADLRDFTRRLVALRTQVVALNRELGLR